MLGVVATLCVVALAARRGQLWFHETHVVCAKEMMSAAMPASPAPTVAPPADPAPDAIRKYLTAHFDEVDYRNGRTAWSGLAYLGAPLVEVLNDRLQRFLPGTRFFKSTLASADYEDPLVDVLVSYRHVTDHGSIWGERDEIRPLLPLKRAPPAHRFIAQFCDLAAPTLLDREEIALGIAELLATITYEGSARLLPNHGKYARAVLRYDGHPYQDIEVLPRGGLVDWIALTPRHTRDRFSVAGHSAFGAP